MSKKRTVVASTMEPSRHKVVRPSSDELVAEVALEIALFQESIAAIDAAAADLLGLNPTDLRCVGRLYVTGRSTAGELAAACGLSRGAMTAALDRLEEVGYVRRLRGESDRRQVMVELTPDARVLTGSMWDPIGREGTARLAAMPEDGLTFLLRFLRRSRALQEAHADRIAAMRDAGRW